MKYFIKTFGCQQNKADSERIASSFSARGFTETSNIDNANYVVINTCMIRRQAEDKVYGMVKNLGAVKEKKRQQQEYFKIIVTGCMVGLAYRDKSGAFFNKIRAMMPEVDEFMPIEEVGFDNEPIRQESLNAWVPISNGCNNFCTFCVVPFTRGREISRPFHDIIKECKELKEKGYQKLTLLGQNVNSYGADLLIGEKNIQIMRDIDKTYFNDNADDTWQIPKEYEHLKPVYVKHLGRQRIPTLFPHLLEEVAKIGFKTVDFFSSNPWDFSDELIDVIARHSNITRMIHLPVQSGDSTVLKRMNRWYTADDYRTLVEKMKMKIPGVQFTTDIIVGFCGETDEEFDNTVQLAKDVGFYKAYISMYSQRPMTAATKVFDDDVPHHVKKKRWQTLENLINKPNLHLIMHRMVS